MIPIPIFYALSTMPFMDALLNAGLEDAGLEEELQQWGRSRM